MGEPLAEDSHAGGLLLEELGLHAGEPLE